MGRLDPFHRTTDPFTKLVPVTVRVKAAEPAAAVAGLRLVIVGAGFVDLIVNETALEVPPPGAGLRTVTLAVPVVTISVAGIKAVSCVPLTNVVVRLEPFHRTIEPFTKSVPS